MNFIHSARFTTRPLPRTMRPHVIAKASPATTASGAAEMISAPCPAAENTFGWNQRMRVFAERLNYTLPAAITVDAPGAPSTVIPQGTRVNVYSLHADRASDQPSVAKQIVGSAKFNTKILAVLTDGTALNSPLGTTPHTGIAIAPSASADQDIVCGDSVSVYPQQKRVDIAFDIWNVVNQVQIITLAW